MSNETYRPRDWSAQAPFVFDAYKSTLLRGPKSPLVSIPQSLAETSGPRYGRERIDDFDADLTRNGRRNGEPVGERIVVTGRVLDDSGRPQKNTLVEIWQANAAGRYVLGLDQHDAPLDPNFFGGGRCCTDDDGRYRFYTVKPGAYPWANHKNAWRPNHIHFSLLGPAFVTRLVTQMYFPGDPLLAYDPLYNGLPEFARARVVCKFDLDVTEPDFALGYVFDIVLRGLSETPMEGR